MRKGEQAKEEMIKEEKDELWKVFKNFNIKGGGCILNAYSKYKHVALCSS